MGDTVLYEAADGVATLTLNRPERLNAITPQLVEDFGARAGPRAGRRRRPRGAPARRRARVLRRLRHRLGLGVDAGRPRRARRGTRSPTTRRCAASSTPTWRCGARPSRSSPRSTATASPAAPTSRCAGPHRLRRGLPHRLPAGARLGLADDGDVDVPPRAWSAPSACCSPATRSTAAARCEWGLASEAVPADELEAAGLALARRVALLPHNQAAMMKLLVNQAFEQMGLHTTQLDRHAAGRRGAPHARGDGLHAARPGRRPRRRGRPRRAVRRLRPGARDGLGDGPAQLHRGGPRRRRRPAHRRRQGDGRARGPAAGALPAQRPARRRSTRWPSWPSSRPSCRGLDVEVAIWLEAEEPRHPLAGIVHALRCARGRPVVVVAGDMPFVTRGLVARARARALARRGRRGAARGRAPAAAVRALRAAGAERARRAATSSRPSRDVVAALDPRILEWPDEEPFFTVNGPEDILQAAALLGGR